MRITQKLCMDLARAGCKPIVGAVQGEGNTRVLEIDLYDKGVAWELPAGTTAAVAFQKPDGTKGLYDQLPNGDPATIISGSTVTAILAPQAITCAGTVLASVVFYDKDMDTLATFPFKITVEANPAAGEQVSNNYYYLQNLYQVNAAYAELLALVKDLQEDGVSVGGAITDEQVESAVSKYLDKHPVAAVDYVTPQMFGAVADGVTPDTAAIQRAFDSLTDGGVLYFPAGKYIVKHSSTANGGDYVAVQVEGKRGIKVVFDNGATIKHNLTTVGRYTMFRFLNCASLEICGGVIEGDRDEHPSVTSGYGSKGIQIRNSETVYVHDMEIRNIFGDCISISGTERQCKNVLIENCTLHDSYRNGLTVGGAKHSTVRNCRIYNISGGAPEAGIDIEAEYGHDNEDITIEGCYIHDCVQNTIAFSSNSYDLKVKNCVLDGGTQGQTTSDNIEIINTIVKGIVNARNNITLRNCVVRGLGAYDSPDYPNVSVKAYNTILSGSNSSPTININGINGKASLYFQDCEFNHLENSTHSLFYAYNAPNTEVEVAGGVVNLWNNPKLSTPIAHGAYSAIKLTGCQIVAKSALMSQSLLSMNASVISLVDCTVDLSDVVTYSPADVATFGPDVGTLNCHNNTFVTGAVVQWVFNLGAFVGNAYLTQNTAPAFNNFCLQNTSGGAVFARGNVTAASVEFTPDDKAKLDNPEPGPAGKSTYEIYVENGGTLSAPEWLANIASVAPAYAPSVDEMTDTSKVYIGPEGTLWGQLKQETILNDNAFDPDSATLGAYLESDGSLVTTGSSCITYCTTDFMEFDGSKAKSYSAKFKHPSVPLSATYARIVYYDANKNCLKQYNLRSDYTSSSVYFAQNDDGSATLELNKLLNGSAVSSSIIGATRYIRLCFYASSKSGYSATEEDIENVEIYFEENGESVYAYQWGDTGIPYAHYAMTDTDYEIIANKVVEKLNAK